jgi:sarcosine oxidase subunit gamma
MNPLHQAERSPIENASAAYQPYGTGKKFLNGQDSAQIQQCAAVDLTNLPRVGFRGTDSASYLTEAGFVLPETPNTLLHQANGSVVARLSATEYLLLGALFDFGESISDLELSWELNDSANYLLPRQDSHAWIQLTGSSIALVMAKLCAVDLSTDAFAAGQIAQTSVARINAIVMNVSDAQAPKFNILCDRASSLYLWNVLLDAIAEFDGKAAGIDSLLTI